MAAVIVHGGAGIYGIPDSHVSMYTEGCEAAARKAKEVLDNDGSALDAVEAAVRVLEDNPAFNSGHGSVLNIAGEVEMDAMIMDGRDLSMGSVAAVKGIANPVSLARKVKEETNHVMLVGEGANIFADEMGFPKVTIEELTSKFSKDKWGKYNKYGEVVVGEFNKPTTHCSDTVGAVVRDLSGNIAAATSTGGITHKRVGRVGDSPLVGSGAYADNSLGGVSCTGHGESIARVNLAFRVLNLLSSSSSAQAAADQSLEYMRKKVYGKGGLIMITNKGEIVQSFTTPRMAWASINKEGQLLSSTGH